jgi:hypothetical protein
MPEIAEKEPLTELDRRFSDPSAEPRSWDEARRILDEAQVYWFTTVRQDGRPHVTSVAGIWLVDAMYVTTGVEEQKAKNLAHNTHCAITTGCNVMDGLDVVIEADAEPETDVGRLQALANAYRAKYKDLFPYEVRDGRFYLEEAHSEVVAYRLNARKALGFGKGKLFSQTRWRFD